MAMSASVRKPVMDDHDLLSNQGRENVLKSLIEVVTGFSEDKCFQALKELLGDHSNLRSKIEFLEGEKCKWDVTREKMFEEVAKVRNDTEEVKKASDEKDKELHRARKEEKKAKDRVIKLEEELKKLKEKCEADQKVISQTTKISEEKDATISKRTEELDRTKQALNRSRDEAKVAQANLDKEKTRHQVTSQQLASIKGLAAPLGKLESKPALKANQEKFDDLFKEVSRLADDYFGQLDVVDDIFDGSSWRHLVEDPRLARIPLPPTNSPAAKRMRATAVLRLIALAAVEHLFHPVYLTDICWEMGQVLHHLYALDRVRAQWVRSVLLSVDQKSQADNGKGEAEAAVREVCGFVGFLLPSSEGAPKNKNSFKKAVRVWFSKTREFWMELQQLEDTFTFAIDQEGASLHPEVWTPLPDKSTLPLAQGGAPAPANGTNRQDGPPRAVVDDIVALIWPAIYYQRAASETLYLLKRGYFLDEPQAVAAREEANVCSRSRAKQNNRQGGLQANLCVMSSGKGASRSVEEFGSFLLEGA